MIPELAVSMLACARIGAIHSIVFGGFSAQALRDRIQDCKSKLVVTADKGVRGGRFVQLKTNNDEAICECPTVEKVIVVKRGDGAVDMEPKRDLWWHDEMKAADISNYCEPKDGCRRPVVHPVYFRLYRKTQRRFAYYRRIYALYEHDIQVDL
jgi:acetyl-CoA synthetase